MKTLLSICLLLTASLAWAGENADSSAVQNSVKGEVREVINVEGFTYLRLKTAQGETWAAVTSAALQKGATVTLENITVMSNFESRSLKRTFDTILFGNLANAKGGAVGSSSLGAAFKTAPPPVAANKLEKISDAPIAKAKGANARTVAEIIANGSKLKDKAVLVRGRVVKFNAEIMGKNWIHLRDGSGSEADGTNDILVTTTDQIRVGDVVTVKGVVRTDKDFSAGYAYKVLIEEATLQK